MSWISQEAIVARIEAVRAEASPPTCLACGSTVVVTQSRVCGRCHVRKPLPAFPKNHQKTLGYDHYCKACKRSLNSNGKALRKRRLFHEILGRAG